MIEHLLPRDRREWGRALLAESPSGRERWAWRAGLLWLLVREGRLATRVLLPLALALFVVIYGWEPGSTNPAAPIYRVYLVATVVMLLALPVCFRPVTGVARTLRIGAYGTLIALVGVVDALGHYAGARFENFQPLDEPAWRAAKISGAITESILLFAVMAAYALGILLLTSRRRSANELRVGAIGALTGALIIFALMPFGNANPLAGFVAVGVLMLVGARGGPLAGVIAGGAGALLLVTLTIPMMLLFPTHVELKWANPDPDVPHGTPYELEMSVGDGAAKYEGFLLAGPLLGLFLGAAGAALTSSSASPDTASRRAG